MADPRRDGTTVPFPWQRIVTITAAIAIVVTALWQVIGPLDDTGIQPSQPNPPASPGATEAIPTADATPTEPVSTPDIAPEWPQGSLPEMLHAAPNRLADGSLPLDSIVTYADIARWMTAAGIATPSSPNDAAYTAWSEHLALLALPDTLRERGLDPAWEAAYGFSLLDVHQVLEVGQAPDYVVIMKGDFDPAKLQAAWVASGYQPVEIEGVTAWSLTPGDTIDLSPPASRPAMGTLNNIVLLDDGTLIGAARTSRLGDTVRAIDGRDDSLADDDSMNALLARGTGIGDIVSAVLSRGSIVQEPAAGAADDIATPVATPGAGEGMPPVRLVLVGLPLPRDGEAATPVASGNPPLTIMLAVDDLDAARQGRDWITARYPGLVSPVTGALHSERFGEIAIRVIGPQQDAPAAIVIAASLPRGTADWLAIVAERDLGFAAWTDDAQG